MLSACNRANEWLYLETTTTVAAGEIIRSVAGSKTNFEKLKFTEFAIPDQYSDGNSVSRISPYGFAGFDQLERITLPKDLSILGIYSFSDCTALKEIVIPDGVTVIPEGAFLNCSALSDVTLPDQLYQISSQAFGNCRSLKKITIPLSTCIISNDAFVGCDDLSCIILDGRTDLATLYWSYEKALEGEWQEQIKDGDLFLLRNDIIDKA